MKGERVKNGILFQGFEWYLNSGGVYADLQKKIVDFQAAGVTAVWLPPATKATGVFDTGYGVYDLYDLGEFDQKGEQRTKYGTKEEYLALVRGLQEAGIEVYADVVLNHKAGADEAERVQAVRVNPMNRIETVEEPKEIEAWTGFVFPGRAGKYSDFQWHWYHFTGVDFDNLSGESGIYRLLGEQKGWAYGVSGELGNYDYLMFADIDHNHPEVREELFRWAKWYLEETGVDGFRMDAAKHIDQNFMRDFIDFIRAEKGDDFYFLGEYWMVDENSLDHYLYETEYEMDLFDVKLHMNLAQASKSFDSYDMRTLFDNTLVAEHPALVVTFVNNHDTQPGQSLENAVDSWFIPIAYGLILLRKDGYPCVFYGDYYGTGGEHPLPGHKETIDRLMRIRKRLAYGEQEDHPIDEHRFAWIRSGTEEHPGRLVVVVNNADAATVTLPVGVDRAGERFVDYMGGSEEMVVIDEEGNGAFQVPPGGIACWSEEGTNLEQK